MNDFIFALRLWFGKKIFGDINTGLFPVGIRLSRRKVVKFCKPPEAEALVFVAANTTIPVPKVYTVRTHKGILCVEMEFVKGQSLFPAWVELDGDGKRALIKELCGYIRQMRQLKPPANGLISSTEGGPWREMRVGNLLFEPEPLEAFHARLRGGVPGVPMRSFNDAVARCHARKYELRYTHGDLHLHNILVHNGKISAIIDWETAGWFPEYWEYTKIHYNMYGIPDFYEMLRDGMHRYDEELEAERNMWKIIDMPYGM